VAFGLVAVLGAQALPLFPVLSQCLFDNFDRRIRRPNVVHLDLFAFQLLVVLEKRFRTSKRCDGSSLSLHIAVEFGIVGGHCDDLVVAWHRNRSWSSSR